jgi:hypothetical protein
MDSNTKKTFSISQLEEKFENGLSIIQLEERFEMTVASNRSNDPVDDVELPSLTVGSW